MPALDRMAARSNAASCVAASGEAPAPLRIADGTLEALKWLGLVLMTADHVNKFLFNERLPIVFEAARLVMPLFGFVLAYNMARPDVRASGAYARTARRLAVFGLAATPPFVVMVGWWPLNVMFMLLLAVGIIWLLDDGSAMQRIAAAALFIGAGAFVEFWWFGVASCVAAWAYCRRPTAGRALGWVLATASLWVVNGNLWALAAVPIVFAATHVGLQTPRVQGFFYLYYLGHLCALLVMRAAMPPP
jgi:hypothetical protein